MLESINGNKRTTLANGGYGEAAITNSKTISLSDTEFDKY